MRIVHLILLGLAACIFTTNLYAQSNVNVVINGIDKPLEDNVRQFLSIEQYKEHLLLSEGRIRRLHNKSPEEISRALQPFGYYLPVIKKDLTQPTPGHWQAIYTIDPGPALLISEFNFTISKRISEEAEYKTLLQNLKLAKREVFNHVIYEDFKREMAKLSSELGYFNARFIEHRVEIDLDAYEARIYLNYDAGQRYYFGEVNLKQDILDDDFLRRYIPFKPDSPYDLNELIDFQQALNDSDYFRTVEVSPGNPQQDSDHIPLNVMLKPHRTHRFSAGIGYGSDTGARIKLGWQMPRVNSKGHRFDTEAKISEIGYSLAAHYRVPVLNPRTDQMVYSAGIVNETTDSTESTVRTIGASLKRSRNAWRESISLNYQQEDYVIADASGTSTLLLPGINWSRVWGNNFIYAIDGLRLDIDLRGASKKLVSDSDFFQLQSSIKAINPINPYNRIIARGTLGSTWTNEFDQLPSSVRFFAGGAQSVRGYAYQSLGPEDADGDVVGGQYLMVGSIEFEHNFDSKWGIAFFYDGGNAIDNLSDPLERGAGFGLRWKSPVGMLRVDLASAVSQDGQPWRLHITIGPDL